MLNLAWHDRGRTRFWRKYRTRLRRLRSSTIVAETTDKAATIVDVLLRLGTRSSRLRLLSSVPAQDHGIQPSSVVWAVRASPCLQKHRSGSR